MNNETYGQIADKVRKVMDYLDVDADDVPRVSALAHVAVGKRASMLDAWAVAALIVPDCTNLGTVDQEWTPAWCEHVSEGDVQAIRKALAARSGGGQ